MCFVSQYVAHHHAVFLRVASPPCQTAPIQPSSGKIQRSQMEMLPSKVAPVRRAQFPDTTRVLLNTRTQ